MNRKIEKKSMKPKVSSLKRSKAIHSEVRDLFLDLMTRNLVGKEALSALNTLRRLLAVSDKILRYRGGLPIKLNMRVRRRKPCFRFKKIYSNYFKENRQNDLEQFRMLKVYQHFLHKAGICPIAAERFPPFIFPFHVRKY